MTSSRRLVVPSALAASTFLVAAAVLFSSALPTRARPADAADEAPAQATVTPGYIVVRGRINFKDRGGDRNHPVGFAKVEVWDKDEGFAAVGELLDTVYTDASGRYASKEILNVDRDGPAGQTDGTQDVFLRIFTENAQVRLLRTGTDRPFQWTSYEITQNPSEGLVRNVPDGIVGFPTQEIYEQTGNVEAIWSFVDMAATWQYLRDRSGREPGPLTAYWAPGSLDGPRYDVDARTLHFRDEDVGFGDLVVQYTAYALFRDLLEPLPESWLACIANVPSDVRVAMDPTCAFVHGVAMALALVVPGDPGYETPDQAPVDLDAANEASPAFDDGDAVPGRIAGAFWDLHEGDGSEDGYDTGNATFADVWDVVDQKRPDTMRAWFDGWTELGKDGCVAIGALYQNTIDYNTAPVIQPIPDVIIDEDETAIVDLRNYVSDVECADAALQFEMVDAGAPEAGVKLLPTNVISITPQANWFGETTVRLTVTDGIESADISFRVIVRSVNDCPVLVRRVPDPPAAPYGSFIELDLETFATDVEDGSAALQWDAEVPPEDAAKLTVAGRGTTRLTFLLDASIRVNYSVIVLLTVTDSDGCMRSQPLALYWTTDRNTPPTIDPDKFVREYVAPVNQTIRVDMTGVANDREDGPVPLHWFVLNPDDLNAQVRPEGTKIIDFEPEVGFLGSNVVQLEVQDTNAARATASITLTWKSRDDVGNLPPEIIRPLLVGKTAGLNAEACYELTDKAFDRDHNRLSLRWFAEPYDDTSLFIGVQGRRELCLRSRTDFIGCLDATFIVRDPGNLEDRYDVQTCWRDIKLFLPFGQAR